MVTTAQGSEDGHGAFFRGLATANGRVHVLKEDPGLLEGVPERTAVVLAQRALVPRMMLPPGPWEPVLPPTTEGDVLGLLVLDGLVERCVGLGERSAPELLGPGDLLRPWDSRPGSGDALTCTWNAHERTVLAVLDQHFSAVACRSSAVLANLLGRTVHRSHELAARLALGQVRNAEERVLLLLRGIAERWGHVTPAGVHVPFALQHKTIARLACMRRPTASTALSALQRSGRLERCADRTWLIHDVPADPAGDAPAPAPCTA